VALEASTSSVEGETIWGASVDLEVSLEDHFSKKEARALKDKKDQIKMEEGNKKIRIH
jgi:hypothetical protein